MKKNSIKILITLGLLLFIVFDIMHLMGCYVSVKFLIEDNVGSKTIDVIYNFVDKVAFFFHNQCFNHLFIGGIYSFEKQEKYSREKK